MSVGTYGNIRTADMNISDIEMYYTYSPDRETVATETFRLNPEELITEENLPVDEQTEGGENLLEGLFNLNLPTTNFNELGIYNIYIKPKTLKTVISDCGVLSALPTVKGIVIDGNLIDETLRENNALQGYRIEYYNVSDGSKLRNTSRFVVTSNKVVPVTENVGNTSQKSVRYRFDDSGNLIFLQLTPSAASNLKPNSIPFIGVAGQNISITNTYFNPIMFEIELVENDLDSIMNIIAGNQIKDVDNGIVTQYDSENNIYKQFNLYEIKEDINNTSLYEVKEKRDNIDTTQGFDEITNF
jgi:hypothetical protein